MSAPHETTVTDSKPEEGAGGPGDGVPRDQQQETEPLGDRQSDASHTGQTAEEDPDKRPLQLRSMIYKGILMNEHEIERVGPMAIRPDDVMVCSYPRSGTTLTQEMTNLIVTKDFETAKTVQLDERVPMLDNKDDRFPYYKGVKHVEEMESPRLIKCHLPYFLLPEEIKRGKGKVIYCARNPKDIVTSFYNVMKWTRLQKDELITLETFFNLFMEGKTYFGRWWEHVKQFWEHRNDENILIMKYEDTIKDLSSAVRRIADYLGKDLTDDEVAKIAEHCTVDNMRKNDMVNLSYYRQINHVNDDAGGFINKGKAGVWRDNLTQDMCKQLDAMLEKEFAGTGKAGVWRDNLTEDMCKQMDAMLEKEFAGTGLHFEQD